MGRFALMILAMSLAASPVAARCIMSYCDKTTATPTPSRSYITNTHRQILGDLYDPGGHGRRIQIRDKHRRILFYIEKDGAVTNTRRQKVGTVELTVGVPDD